MPTQAAPDPELEGVGATKVPVTEVTPVSVLAQILERPFVGLEFDAGSGPPLVMAYRW